MIWFKRLVLAVIAGIALIVFVATVAYWNHARSVRADYERRLSEWRSTPGWLRPADFELVRGAIVAAEDPEFFTAPKLDCGLTALAGSMFSRGELKNFAPCSSIFTHATRLAMAEIYARPSRRWATEIPVLPKIAETPDTALEIILNRSYLGMREDGTPILGFAPAAEHYFGKSPQELERNEAATLAGMLRSPQRYNLKTNPEAARARRDQVLKALEK